MNCTDANCPAYAKCLAEHYGSLCKAIRATYGLSDTVTATNYDRLIRKTPEEMAQIIVSGCPPDYPKGECREYEKNDGNLDCPKCWLDWLLHEAET